MRPCCYMASITYGMPTIQCLLPKSTKNILNSYGRETYINLAAWLRGSFPSPHLFTKLMKLTCSRTLPAKKEKWREGVSTKGSHQSYYVMSPFARKYLRAFHWLPVWSFLSEVLIGWNVKHASTWPTPSGMTVRREKNWQYLCNLATCGPEQSTLLDEDLVNDCF